MLNKITLIGRVGNDPEIKQFETNKVANFSLATTERGYKTSSGREIPERTDWHRIIVWGGLAKVVEGYVKKGSKVYVEGKLRYREYADSANVKRQVSEIYADNLLLLDSRPQQAQTTYDASSQYETASPEPQDDLPF
jgi:single-strand DNA-binding protein